MDQRYSHFPNLFLTIGLTALSLLTLFATAQSTGLDDPYRIEEFSITPPGELEVKTSGGHITVKAGESNMVRVEMYVRRNGRELTPSDTDLDNYDIEIETSGNRVTATAERRGSNRNWGRNNLSISFVVYTPREMSSHLRTSGGHITASGLDGNQRLSTSGGHLKMSSLTGVVEARTSGGHIEVDDFSGQIEARTSGGHIEVADAEGTLDFRTSGGHIDLNNVAGTLKARTSGGSIDANLLSIEQHADLKTSGGHISISVPSGIGLNLDLRGTSVNTSVENFSGTIERDEINGEMNGGGPSLSARTSGGRVKISYH